MVEGRLRQTDGTSEKVAVKTMKRESSVTTRHPFILSDIKEAVDGFLLFLQWIVSRKGKLKSS